MTEQDPRALRDAFGSFMTGVTIVTACTPDGEPVGFTANSFTSVSLNPPLLLVCPATSLSSFDVFSTCDSFAVSILSEDQRDLSNRFAAGDGDRFAEVDWSRDTHGNPVFAGACAQFSCRTFNRVPGGDHLILIGEVTQFQNEALPGLGYANGSYFSLGLERDANDLSVTGNTKLVSGVILTCEGEILVTETDQGYEIPTVISTSSLGSLGSIKKMLKNAELDCDVGSVYSVFEDRKRNIASVYYLATTTNAKSSTLGEFRPISLLSDYKFTVDVVGSMMRRFQLEYEHGHFGTYLGDESAGHLHTL